MLKKISLISIAFLLSACAFLPSKKVEEEKNSTQEKEIYPLYNYPQNKAKLWKSERATYQIINCNKVIQKEEGESVFFKDDLSFIQDSNYELSFSLQSEEKVDVIINLKYAGTDLISETTTIDKELKTFSYQFKPGVKQWDGVFSLTFTGKKSTIKLNNFLIKNLDEQNVGVRINQIGYLPPMAKHVTFSSNAGDCFFLLNKEGKIVYQSHIFNAKSDEKYSEFVSQGDFSSFKKVGTYKIITEVGTSSPWFRIDEDIYTDLHQKVLRFFTLQRSGIALSKDIVGPFKRSASHTSLARVYGWGAKEIDVSGGWYDAGDYGRYLQTGIKALTCLLMSYYFYPDNSDNYNIVESKNNKPDILDEAAYELKWLLKMRNEKGEPYNKVTTKRFASVVSPEEDNEQLFVLPPWTLTSNSFVGICALASIIYQQYDKSFAEELKQAALKIVNVVETNASKNYHNPSEFVTGQYDDDSDNDEKYFACSGLYVLTKDKKYYDLAYKYYKLNYQEGTLSANMYDYGSALLLKTLAKNDTFYQLLKEDTLNRVNKIKETLEKNAYPYPLNTYQWGSNQHVCEVIFQLQLAYYCSPDFKYLTLASLCLSYLMGQNANNMCFITGFGDNYPINPHSRIARAKKSLLVGALVGGVNQYLSEDIQKIIPLDTPIAKRYKDDFNSYSTNEVAIVYNATLLLALNTVKLFK